MKLKKEFGQHFLNDESICQRIVDSLTSHTSLDMPLLEIGPGGGAITKYLYKIPFADYKMVEIDKDKVQFLTHSMGIDINKIIQSDFLKIERPFPNEFNIIGNFPYNISSQIMFKILEWKDSVQFVVGMFQKEVAVRIASKEGNKDYGILSVILQAFYDIEYLFDVPPNAFTPPPKVMSGVISLSNNQNIHRILFPQKFLKLIKVCFSMRRKTLRNNLKGILPTEMLENDFYNKRAEQVSVIQFIDLYKTIYEKK